MSNPTAFDIDVTPSTKPGQINGLCDPEMSGLVWRKWDGRPLIARLYFHRADGLALMPCKPSDFAAIGRALSSGDAIRGMIELCIADGHLPHIITKIPRTHNDAAADVAALQACVDAAVNGVSQ